MVPEMKTDNPVVRDTWYFAWKTIWGNQCEGASGSTPFPYFSASRPHYSSQWYWDEAYISMVVRHLNDDELPFRYFKNFLSAQFDDGGIPGSLSFANDFESSYAREIETGISTGMQPPVLGLTMQLLKEDPGWPSDLEPYYLALLKNIQWHYKPGRDTDQDGLAEYHNTYESSADMSPRFTSQLINPDRHDGPIRATESVEFNVWLSLLWDDLADMAERLGRSEESARHRKKARSIEQMVRDLMWNEEDGFYYDLDGASNRQIKVMTPYGFTPMLLLDHPKKRSKRLVKDHLYNKAEFWGEYPVPSVPYNHSEFDPEFMWLGPVWINMNWLIIEGLHRSGFKDEARELSLLTVEMVGSRYENGVRVRSPRMHEWYKSPTGEPLGNEHFSWTTLVNDMIIRFISR